MGSREIWAWGRGCGRLGGGAAASSGGGRQAALVRAQRGGVPLGAVGVVDGDECGLAAHGQAYVVLEQVAIDLPAGMALTLFTPLWLVVPGMLIFTFGFFGAHSVASSWIGRRAVKAKGQASSLYLFCYYVGYTSDSRPTTAWLRS